MADARLAGVPEGTGRETEEPTLDEFGAEVHPGFGIIGASRVQSGPPGAVLFDSDLRHNHYVVLRVRTARRTRDLNHDHIMGSGRGADEVVEVAMSEAQWASFVSSMNAGEGVPCTIQRREGKAVPRVPYQPRLAESFREVHDAGDRALAKIREAFVAYDAHRTKANRDTLKYAIKNAVPNMDFAAKSLSRHAENVVQRARADVEAFVAAKARQVGLNPADVGGALELGPGEPERDDDDGEVQG